MRKTITAFLSAAGICATLALFTAAQTSQKNVTVGPDNVLSTPAASVFYASNNPPLSSLTNSLAAWGGNTNTISPANLAAWAGSTNLQQTAEGILGSAATNAASAFAPASGSTNYAPITGSTNYAPATSAASQAEAEAGTEAGLRMFSPLRVAQAIAALAAGGGAAISTPHVAYVESTGNDSTAAIGDPSKPYLTAQAAYNALFHTITWNGTSGVQGTIFCGVGDHGSITCDATAGWPAGLYLAGLPGSSLTAITQPDGTPGDAGTAEVLNEDYYVTTQATSGGTGGPVPEMHIVSDGIIYVGTITRGASRGGAGGAGGYGNSGNGGAGGTVGVGTFKNVVCVTFLGDGSFGGAAGFAGYGGGSDGSPGAPGTDGGVIIAFSRIGGAYFSTGTATMYCTQYISATVSSGATFNNIGIDGTAGTSPSSNTIVPSL